MMSAFPFGSDIGKLISRETIAVVYTNNDNPTYLLYLLDLISRAKKNGRSVILIFFDFNEIRLSLKPYFSEISKVSFAEKRRKLNSVLLRHIRINFSDEIVVHKFRIHASDLKYKLPKTTSNLQSILDSILDPTLRNSLASICATHILKSSLFSKRLSLKQRQAIENYINAYFFVRDSTLNLLSSLKIDCLISLNGRVPDQAALNEVCNFLGTEHFFLEHGAVPGHSFHIQTFQTQDSQSFYKFFEKQEDSIPIEIKQELCNASNAWLLKKPQAFTEHNMLSSLKSHNSNLTQTSLIPCSFDVLVFTSSINEFDAYETEESGLTQLDNIEKFLISLSSEPELRIGLRIHPNQSNYHPRDLKYLVSRLKRFKCEIFLPWNPINSYSLLENSRWVAVWDSTIGLESLILKEEKVLTLKNSFFDGLNMSVKVDNFDISKSPSKLSSKSVSRAKLFLSYRYLTHGEKLNTDSIEVRNLQGDLDKIKYILSRTSNGNHFMLVFKYKIRQVANLLTGVATVNEWLVFLTNLFGYRLARHILEKYVFSSSN